MLEGLLSVIHFIHWGENMRKKFFITAVLFLAVLISAVCSYGGSASSKPGLDSILSRYEVKIEKEKIREYQLGNVIITEYRVSTFWKNPAKGSFLPKPLDRDERALLCDAVKTDPSGLMKIKGTCGMTFLHLLAMAGDEELFCSLLDSGVDINVAMEDGFTPLYWAARHGRVSGDFSLVMEMLDRGANPRSCGVSCVSLLKDSAAHSGDILCVRKLLETGCEPENEKEWDKILNYNACRNNDIRNLLKDWKDGKVGPEKKYDRNKWSRTISMNRLDKHVWKGEWKKTKSGNVVEGGHGRPNRSFLVREGIEGKVTIDAANGNMIQGISPVFRNKSKHTWFPFFWTRKDVETAINIVANEPENRRIDNGLIFGTFKGVRVAVFLRNGEIVTAYPVPVVQTQKSLSGLSPSLGKTFLLAWQFGLNPQNTLCLSTMALNLAADDTAEQSDNGQEASTNKYKQGLKRLRTIPLDKFDEETERMTALLTRNENAAIAFLERCDQEELRLLSCCFVETAFRLHSQHFVDSLRLIVEKSGDRNLRESVELAGYFMSPANAAARKKPVTKDQVPEKRPKRTKERSDSPIEPTSQNNGKSDFQILKEVLGIMKDSTKAPKE